MGDVLKMSPPEGSYLATITVFRMPDGSTRAVLEDMASDQIEVVPTITERFFKVASWCMSAAPDLMRQGLRFDEETRALNDDEGDSA